LTEQELEIMKVVWQRNAATVRDVYETLRQRRSIAYTTVMTMMNILERKKHLRKRQGERAYVYEPVRPRQRVVREMVRDFLGRVFDGSARPLLVHLVEDRRLDENDLREILRSIKEDK
jgi:predicted transcriptional regulator